MRGEIIFIYRDRVLYLKNILEDTIEAIEE
jgi:hypothetical protein